MAGKKIILIVFFFVFVSGIIIIISSLHFHHKKENIIPPKEETAEEALSLASENLNQPSSEKAPIDAADLISDSLENNLSYQLSQVAPELHNRIGGQINEINEETLEESIRNLSRVDMYFWPGPTPESGGVVDDIIPIKASIGKRDMQKIMSNRRFLRVYAELSQLSKAVASKLLNDAFEDAFKTYQQLYGDYLEDNVPRYTHKEIGAQVKGNGWYVLPGFQIDYGSGKDLDKSKIHILGAKLQILSYVWISGLLELHDCEGWVKKVTQEALLQRDNLYHNDSVVPYFKIHTLQRASLYNRQILSTGLLGAAMESEKARQLEQDMALSWKSEKSPVFDAALTGYDFPVRSWVMPPDYSRGELKLKFPRPLEDAEFDEIVKACGIDSRDLAK